MIPVDQRYGDDCSRAAIASLLELSYEDVPHFAPEDDEDPEAWFARVANWLWAKGMIIIELPPECAPVCYHLANGPSHRVKNDPCHHMVVMWGREIVHDPANGRWDIPHRDNPMRRGISVKNRWVIVPADIGAWIKT